MQRDNYNPRDSYFKQPAAKDESLPRAGGGGSSISPL